MFETGRKIARNTIYFTTGKILGDLCGFIFLVYFARVFGAGALGKYTFSMALAGLLSIFISMGMNTCMTREVSKDLQQEPRYISNILLTQAILAILVWGLIVTIALLFSADSETAMILVIIGLYQVLYKLTMVFHTQFMVHEAMQYPALLELSHKLIILVFGGLIIWITRDPVLALATYPLGALLMLLVAAVISFSLYGRLIVQPDLKFISNLIRRAFPFFILLVLSVIFDRIGLIILTTMQGEFDTGIYSASDRLVATMLQPVAIFGAIILPVMSRLSVADSERLVNLYETCIKLVVGLLLPLSTFLFLLAEELVLIVYGDMFTEAVEVLKILSWLLLVGGVSVVASTMMMAINHEHELLRAKFFIVAGYIVACLMVIPLYSYIGLSIVKLLAFAAISFYCLYYLRDRMPLSRIWDSIRAPLFSSLVAAVIYIFATGIEVWARAIVLLVSYIVMMCFLRAIRLQDLAYLKRVLLGQSSV